MEYREIIYYLALLLVFGSVAEIYVRHRKLGVREDRTRDGVVVSGKQSVVPPIALLIVAIVVAIFTAPVA